jgi:hypothetical protein
MAEKKFFVDINLQGSALTNAKIGTNSAIGSTEGAFGYDSASHRLQYFNGSTTENVANLADIAAVTGGLIFQGGYDPTTNTPDITDGTAFKGFFWAATAAGTFLGESVQVGDSIVAKVDAAGATLADWLILQGNIVIATDSVDGISRLATQTEANDGTEAGAVVITPATLQGKIDAQITPEISNKLPLTGGTMTGNIDMNYNDVNNAVLRGTLIGDTLDAQNNSIANLAAPTNGGDAANKTYVDDNTSNKLPLAGGTMSGNINMSGNEVTGASAVRTGNLYSSSTGDSIYVQENLDFENEKSIINLPAPTNDGDAANKIYVDDADALKLDLAGGTMTGSINMASHNITGADTLGTIDLEVEQIYAQNPVGVNTDLDFKNSHLPTNLPAPTNNGDAANKQYVDTAESNANTYADDAIATISGKITIPVSGWLSESTGYYQFIDTSAFGNHQLITQVVDANNTVIELDLVLDPNSTTVRSNILPSENFYLLVTKVF